MDKLILVARHNDHGWEPLPEPYREIDRTKCVTPTIKQPTLTWSEYAVLWSAFPLSPEVEMVGFEHYRCMLDFDPENLDLVRYIPYTERKAFAEKQLNFIEHHKSLLTVSYPLMFGESSLWEQLSQCYQPPNHHGIMDILSRACSIFDAAVGVNSAQELQTTNTLFSRNIFYGPAPFARDWADISLYLAELFDVWDEPYLPDRWGGFILERFFSIYVKLVERQKTYKVQAKPLTFFQ